MNRPMPTPDPDGSAINVVAMLDQVNRYMVAVEAILDAAGHWQGGVPEALIREIWVAQNYADNALDVLGLARSAAEFLALVEKGTGDL